MSVDKYTLREKNEVLRSQLENERSSFVAHWRDLNNYISPRRARFFVTDRNRGDKRNQNIINSTATMAARTLRSGMMSGITSPARPWFRLQAGVPGLEENPAVKQWLHNVSKLMSDAFLRSNLYNALPVVYNDIGVFGTAALWVEEDFEEVFRFYPLPIGSYSIALNDKLKVDTIVRTFAMTIRQLVARFGEAENGKINWDNFSAWIKDQYEIGNLETWVDVVHVVRPNEKYDPNKVDSKFKKFVSIYYESGYIGGGQSQSSTYLAAGVDKEKTLSEKGYDYFPVLCPRWEVTGEDIYGTDCPGMVSLGDIKQLQLMEKRLAQAIDKKVNPPMVGHTSLKNAKASLLPGDITYVDDREGKGFRPAHEVNFQVTELQQKIYDIERRISRGFFEDLFLMLAQSDRRNITAREIEERHEEKLLALGPVLEQLNQDLLDPLIDIAFRIMEQQGFIPPAPQELQGMPLKVEYVSIMAQAQKLVGLAGVERFTGYVGNVASYAPGVLDKIDTDQLIDIYSEIVSLPPGIVRSDEQVAQMRQAAQQAAQQQQQMEMMNQMSGAAKNMSQAKLGDDSVLTEVLGL